MRDKRIQIATVAIWVALIVVSILAVMPEKAADHDSGVTAAELGISESVDGHVLLTRNIVQQVVVATENLLRIKFYGMGAELEQKIE